MYGETKTKVMQTHIDHPLWTAMQIAKHTGVSPASVRGIIGVNGLALRSEAARKVAERIGLIRERDPDYRIPYAGAPSHGERDD